MKPRSSVVTVSFLVVLLASTTRPSAGQYIGQEPERLVRLLHLSSAAATSAPIQAAAHLAAMGRWEEAEAAYRDAALDDPAARLGLAVSLAQQGRPDVAHAELARGDLPAPRLRYAALLLTLQVEPDLRFADLRGTLDALLRDDPFLEDAFDVWLGLNPAERELETSRQRLAGRTEPEARWQEAEIWLRLGKPKNALAALAVVTAHDEGASRGRVDRMLAWTHFLLNRDEDGQAIYERLLTRVGDDDETAAILYQDLAAIATPDERSRFANLSPDERGRFFTDFWQRRDPLPVEPRNPRLAEHYRRLADALERYGLQSNGRGYFTDREVFATLSPALPHFDSTALFEHGPASRYWLDHRGVIAIRHGEPVLRMPAQPYAGTQLSESWLIRRYQTHPMIFHFVRRPAVGEWSLVANLGVAAVRRGDVPDDPEAIIAQLSPQIPALYATRWQLHPLYGEVAQARSEAQIQAVLREESQVTSRHLEAAFGSDSTAYYTADNTLPLAVSISNLYRVGRPALELSLAADLREVDPKRVGDGPQLDVTIRFYDANWATVLREERRSFRLEPPQSGKFRDFIAAIAITDLDPENYRIAIDVYQPQSGRIGLARGAHEVAYVPETSLGMSDLRLLRKPDRTKGEPGGAEPASEPWLPWPQPVALKSAPYQVAFELYNLEPGADGRLRYEVEERVLTLYEKPGFFGQLAGYGQFVGQLFFPLYTFATQLGASTLSQALISDTAGLAVATRFVERPTAGPVTRETLQIDSSGLKPGVHTVYVTVRDLNANEITSTFMTLQLDK